MKVRGPFEMENGFDPFVDVVRFKMTKLHKDGGYEQ